MNGMKKSLEELGLLIKSVSETIQNKAKGQKSRFLGIILGARLLGNLLTGKGIRRAGERIIRAGQDF